MEVVLANILNTLLKYLSDRDKLNTISTCKYLWAYQNNITYSGVYYYSDKITNPHVPVEYVLGGASSDIPIPNPIKVLTIIPKYGSQDRVAIPKTVEYLILNERTLERIHMRLPFHITRLTIHISDYLKITILPETIVRLHIDGTNDRLDHIIIPRHIIRLHMNVFGNGSYTITEPSAMKYLKLGSVRRSSSRQYMNIPRSVTHVILRWYAHMDWNLLPTTVTHLELPVHYNQPTRIHTGMKYIIFGSDFNTPLKPKTFPNTITYIKFGANFNRPIDPGILPESLTHIIFGDKFDKEITAFSTLPNLVHVEFGCMFDKSIRDLPSSVRYLKLGDGFTKALQLPPDLTTLILGKCFKKDIRNLPQKLQYIQLPEDYPRKIRGYIPRSVTRLYVGKQMIGYDELQTYYPNC